MNIFFSFIFFILFVIIKGRKRLSLFSTRSKIALLSLYMSVSEIVSLNLHYIHFNFSLSVILFAIKVVLLIVLGIVAYSYLSETKSKNTQVKTNASNNEGRILCNKILQIADKKAS